MQWFANFRSARPRGRARDERLRKLVSGIEALVKKDESMVRRDEEIAQYRRDAAAELYSVCRAFVEHVNALLPQPGMTLDPPDYGPESFRDGGMNLFQINVRGRIMQIEFESTAETVSTENFRVPYIMEGAVRRFNQQLLDRDLIEEQLLFYCLEGRRGLWRTFDARTYRTGPFDEDYLISLMEQLL